VVPNRFQPREHFDEEALASLTASIREMGVFAGPFSYVPRSMITTRSLRASVAGAPAKTTPDCCTFRRSFGRSKTPPPLEHALVENLHREDLNPLEEGRAYQQLMEDFGLTQELVAQRVGRSRSAVANTLRLFQLPPSLQRMIADGRLTAGHARALLATPDRDLQEELADEVLNRGLSVRDVEQLVRDRMAPEARRRCPEPEPISRRPSLTPSTHPPLREPAVPRTRRAVCPHVSTHACRDLTGKRGRVGPSSSRISTTSNASTESSPRPDCARALVPAGVVTLGMKLHYPETFPHLVGE